MGFFFASLFLFGFWSVFVWFRPVSGCDHVVEGAEIYEFEYSSAT